MANLSLSVGSAVAWLSVTIATSVDASLLPSDTSAQPSQFQHLLDNYFIPPDEDKPGSTKTSATRNEQSCHPDEPRIRAIAPPQGYGLTLNPRPAITLDLANTSASKVALVLQDETGNLHGSAILPLPHGPLSRQRDRQNVNARQAFRRISFRLPESMAELEPQQRYRWSLVVICGESIEPDDPTFVGWIERREKTPSFAQQWSQRSAQERARWYAQNGYWYDLVQMTSYR